MPIQFRQYFKDIAEAETRSITIFEGHGSGLPPGEYGFIEYYCDEKNCDCRRVHFMVVADWSKKPLAMIAYGWESPSYYAKWLHSGDKKVAAKMSGVELEIMFDQSEYADAAKNLCENDLLADPNYLERIKRHYRMMRDYVDGREQFGPTASKDAKKDRKKTCLGDDPAEGSAADSRTRFDGDRAAGFSLAA